MSVEGTEKCFKCGSDSWSYSDYKECFHEIHCLNDECGFFNVCGETGFRTPEEFKEWLEETERKKCEKCGVVDFNHNPESPFCEVCE
jgi:hypothetical protein|tara:strand:- start:218 stop:478 length:261 start_codon:yes stop_codon:yes gene_type:complete